MLSVHQTMEEKYQYNNSVIQQNKDRNKTERQALFKAFADFSCVDLFVDLISLKIIANSLSLDLFQVS